jgi:hypothetical protein
LRFTALMDPFAFVIKVIFPNQIVRVRKRIRLKIKRPRADKWAARASAKRNQERPAKNRPNRPHPPLPRPSAFDVRYSVFDVPTHFTIHSSLPQNVFVHSLIRASKNIKIGTKMASAGYYFRFPCGIMGNFRVFELVVSRFKSNRSPRTESLSTSSIVLHPFRNSILKSG